ncbi:hypothetical protein AgCh_037225 [Apium graveolens]
MKETATSQRDVNLNSTGPSLAGTSCGGNVTKQNLGFTPKLEFPKFDGTNPRLWIKKCCRYFSLCKITEDQKVDLASLNMVDKAEYWMSSYLIVRKYVDWSDFVIDVTARFRDDFSYEYILESFIGGLKPAVKPFVRAFKPNSMAAVVEFARLQEEVLSCATWSTHKITNYGTQKPLAYTPALANTKPPLLPTPATKLINPIVSKVTANPSKTFKHIPADVRAEKIAKGLCYFCDQAYTRGHKYQFRENQLFTVEISAQDIESEIQVEEDEHLSLIKDLVYP